MAGGAERSRSGGRVRIVAVVVAWLGVFVLLTGTSGGGAVAPAPCPPDPEPAAVPVVTLPGPRVSPLTLSVLAAVAAALWVNAAVNAFRFNVVIAVLGSLPVLLAAARAYAVRGEA